MLTTEHIEAILERLPRLTIGVLGDLFLDRYLDIDAGLTEASLETNLEAFQVVQVRALPGALGTIINNLVALGVGRVCPVSLIGDDGEGYELRQALAELTAVDRRWIISTSERRTPTYTKPILYQEGEAPYELNRLDIKNRTPTPGMLEGLVLEGLNAIWGEVDALIVLDQVTEEDCGVVTARIRKELATLGEAQPRKFVLADSRERIRAFRGVSLKPNERECEPPDDPVGWHEEFEDHPALALARAAGRPVFCTLGQEGIRLALPREDGRKPLALVPAFPVSGPIDIVGAGDSTSAGIACAVAAGMAFEEAAAFGNLIASITIQQVGTTGTASPDQVRQRWREVHDPDDDVASQPTMG